MRRLLVAVFVVGCLLTQRGLAQTEETPRAIIQKALKATGGEALARQARSVKLSVKGIIYEQGESRCTGDFMSQFPAQYRMEMHIDVQGSELNMTQVLNGSKGWTRENQMKVEEADVAMLREMQENGYVSAVTDLVPLLDDRNYVLTLAGDSKVGEHATVGVKVTSEGKPDVLLLFDKSSGLLLKEEHRRADAGGKRQAMYEEYFDDYRPVDPGTAAAEKLKSAKIPTENPALLQYLKDRSLQDADRELINTLIRKLGDSSFEVREKAKEDLVKQGIKAAPLLTRATKDPDAEVSGRAKECLETMGSNNKVDSTALISIVRLLAARRPPDTAETLLSYLPSAPDETVMQEVQAALAAVAFLGDKPDPALVRALDSNSPVRKAAAAAILDRDGKPARGPAGRQIFLSGIKRPMKSIQVVDGKKVMELAVTEVQFFNRFDDAMFAKP
jgi:hypothetical protein